ncbi:MAG: hypothetical protein ACFB0C_07365 [Leptolyngbyaceae cyanobacterium]
MTHTSSSPQPTASVHALADVLPLPLQHTLNHLTVNLDQELMRYRQQKQGITPKPQPVFRPRPRPLSLIDIKSQSLSGQPAAKVTPPPLPLNPKLNHAPSADTVSATPSASAAVGGALATQTAAPETSETYLASSAALLDDLAADAPTTDPRTVDPREVSLQGTSWGNILGTPLGMGGLLLLLVASAGLGYALVNPVAIQHLASQTPLGRFLGADNSEKQPDEAAALTAEQPESALDSRHPDLSQSEFTDLNLSRLSTLPGSANRPTDSDRISTTNSTPTTSAAPPTVTTSSSPTPANTAQTAATPSVATAPSAATPQAERAANPRPAPAAATALPAVPTATSAPTQAAEPVSQPTPSAQEAATPSSETYYVITEYRGDPSLAEARQVVGDAYVHNFPIGARIQLGIYDTAADAEADAAALQNQGISATVYSP